MKNGFVYGVGMNDANYKVKPTIKGKTRVCPFYARWKDMITRAYSDRFHEKYLTYRDVTVCEEWHLFSNFKKWMEEQDWEGKELDKDILYPNNKVYSPTTCCFAKKEVNGIFSGRIKPRSKYLIGVSFYERRQKYTAQIAIHGKKKHLGYFDSEDEAYRSYVVAKISYIKTFLSGVDERIKTGLQRHINALEKQIT